MDTSIHYIMWRISHGGAELLVNHYIRRFACQRALYAYSLRQRMQGVYDESIIQVEEGPAKSWWRLWAYFTYCHRHKDDIFHLMNTGPIILALTLLAGVNRTVYHIHGTKYWKKRFDVLYLKPLWIISSWFKPKFIANSEYSASIFKKKVLSLKPEVIYNGFDIQDFLEKRKLRTAPNRLVYAGRLCPGKNVDLVIRLFEEVAEDFPQMELHIAGEGNLRPALEAQAAASSYHQRIKFHGFVQDIASFYGGSDIFVFLSAYESFGNVLAEALLTGMPILTSDVPVFSEIHQGESAFVLGHPDHYEKLKNNFITALNNFPILARKAWEASEIMKNKFSIEKHLTAIEQLYERY